jgi:hypothetical protein
MATKILTKLSLGHSEPAPSTPSDRRSGSDRNGKHDQRVKAYGRHHLLRSAVICNRAGYKLLKKMEGGPTNPLRSWPGRFALPVSAWALRTQGHSWRATARVLDVHPMADRRALTAT